MHRLAVETGATGSFMPFFSHRFVTLQPLPPARLPKPEFRPTMERFSAALGEAIVRRDRTAIYRALKEVAASARSGKL